MLSNRVLIAVVVAFSAVPITAQVVPASDAVKHIGEQATVCGTISGEHYAAQAKGSPTFIDFERPYPNQSFTVVVWGRDKTRVGNLPTAGWLCVNGEIELYKGRAEIILHDEAGWYDQKAPTTQQPQLSNDSHYINSDGQSVHSPAYSSAGIPAGATAQCGDGTYSFSRHRQGTCSHHGGVAKWL